MQEIVENKQKHKNVIPSALWRQREDGTYDKSPNDPDYNKKYYQQHGKIEYTCELCKRTISSNYQRARHQRSKLCQKFRCLVVV